MESQQSYSCSAIAELLGVTPRRIRQLVKDGVIPKVGRGKYDRIACVRGYVTYLRNTIGQQGSGNAGLKQSRTDLIKMQQKNAELAYKQKSEQLIDIEDVQILVDEGAAVFTGQRRSMGRKLARQLAGMSDPTAIMKLLNAKNDEILQATSEKLYNLAGRAE